MKLTTINCGNSFRRSHGSTYFYLGTNLYYITNHHPHQANKRYFSLEVVTQVEIMPGKSLSHDLVYSHINVYNFSFHCCKRHRQL